MKKIYAGLLMLFAVNQVLSQQNSFSDWRGPNRDGIYPEKGLLKTWPETGPKLLWKVENLGFGYSSPAVANKKIYITGIKDTTTTTGTLFVFDLMGNLLWEKDYGPDFCLNFSGTRSTPVVDNDRIYITGGMGALYCLNSENGHKIWSVDFIREFGVDSVIQFGYSESPLLFGNKLVCVAGGKENNIVALDKFTGKKIWSSRGYGEPATYCSPVFFNHNGNKMIVAMSSGSIMGIDANTGQMYWRVHQYQDNKIHANTPVYFDGKVLVSSASRRDSSGLVQLQLSDDGRKAEIKWRYGKFINLMGGIIKIDNYIFGSAYIRNDWQVIDWNTGNMVIQNKELGGGSVVYADGLFYCYAERDGEVALVEADSTKIKIISRFKVPFGIKEHWAHLVIAEGRLFVRHGNTLMVYDIKQN